MPYYPHKYPPRSWWAGKTFFRESVRIFEKNPTPSDQQKIIIRENLNRAINTLLEFPATNERLQNKDTENLPTYQTHIKWNNECIKQDFHNVKGYFFNWYYKKRYDEYTYYEWSEFYDNEQLSFILDISADSLVEQEELSEDQIKKIESYHEKNIEEQIQYDHDKYWDMEEYELLYLFGLYGEFIGS